AAAPRSARTPSIASRASSPTRTSPKSCCRRSFATGDALVFPVRGCAALPAYPENDVLFSFMFPLMLLGVGVATLFIGGDTGAAAHQQRSVVEAPLLVRTA